MRVRVLLVATREGARAGLAQRLGRSGDIDLVGAVRDVKEAKAFVTGKPDLVLVDVHEGDGYNRELCQELTQAFSSPLVVLTSFMTRERWTELREAGVATFLVRHVDTRALAEDLTRVAQQFAAGPRRKG